jgi:hypothetical protein
MRKNTLFYIVSILVAFSCNTKKTDPGKHLTSPQQAVTDSVVMDENTVATVGASKINDQIIRYRLSTEEAYGNTGLNKTSGLIMLINDALETEIAKKYNQHALPDEIEQFKQHADATSKAPDILKKIKNVYEGDIASYDLWFISPKIVNRKIRDYFSANKEYNLAALNRIQPALKKVQEGEKMKEIAKSYNLNYAVDSIPVKPLDMTPALQNYPDARLPFENPMIKYIAKLKPKEMYPEVIEESYSFMIVRLINHNQNRYLIERLSVQKPDFDSWFKKEAEVIPILIYDPDLKNELRKSYSNLWWVPLIK